MGNRIKLMGLSEELAARGRIGIWISGSRWRVCIVIKWGSRVNPEVSVDGREVDVEEVEAQVDGEPTDFHRVLALLGTQPVTADMVEVYDPVTIGASGVVTDPTYMEDVTAVLMGNRIKLMGLSEELAAKGRIGIWISGSRWRVCIVIKWGSRVNPEVSVDGREVDVEEVEAQVDGEPTDFHRVLALLGDQPVTADMVEFDENGTGVPAQGVTAVLKGNRIELNGLSDELAARGRIGIWISGSRWRVCIVIKWGSRANPEVSVDGREVDVEEVEAQVDGEPTDFHRVLALLGDEPVTAEMVEFDENGTGVPAQGVTAVLKGNEIELSGLSDELAARGRIGIWISGSRWRVCIVIKWGSRVNPEVSVDGREVDVEEVEAQVDGEPTDFHRVLALLGEQPVTADMVEVYDPVTIGASGVVTDPTHMEDVTAVLMGNRIKLTGLSEELAAKGRIGIWISGSRWRVCIVIKWGSRVNPEVSVDGREVDVEEVEAQVDGEETDFHRVLALLGEQPVTADMVEFYDPATINASGVVTDLTVIEDATAVLKGNQIEITGLSDELADKGRIGIWISGSRWRVCIVIKWETQANLDVSVDGRNIDVEEVEAEVDGELTELRRVLTLLGNDPVTADTVELYDPEAFSITGVITEPIMADGVMAVVKGNHIELTGLSNELAARGRIGIWISGSRWRICIVIKLSAERQPKVSVDGRPVTTYDATAELDGEAVEPARVLALLGDEPVTAESVELDENGQGVPAQGVTAEIRGNRIELTGLRDELAARGRLSIWISGGRWRLCITVEWGKFVSRDNRVELDLPDLDVHKAVVIDYSEISSPTKPLPLGRLRLQSFTLDAQDHAGQPVTQFGKEYTLVVHYTDEDLVATGIEDESTLQLAFLNEDTGIWEPIPTEVDVENNVATGRLNHFTEFTLFANAASSDTTLTKAFIPTTIAAGGTTTLIFTIAENPIDDFVANTVRFTDTLPSGLVLATPANVQQTCTGGTITAVNGGSTINVVDTVLPDGTSNCTVSVDVTAATTGSYVSGPTDVSGLVGTQTSSMTGQTLTVNNLSTGNLDIDIALTPNPAGVNEFVNATITLTNTGSLNITALPFQLDYDTVDLDFYPTGLAAAPTDVSDDGRINWSDLTRTLGDLVPNTPVTLVVQFTAIQDTTSNGATAPCNTAGVSCISATANGAQDSSGTVPTANVNASLDIELSLQNKYTLGDFVWQDNNGDGVKDSGETGINGVLLNLYLDGSDGSNPDGVPQASEFLLSTTTVNSASSPESISQDGYYTFSVVTGPGKIYIVDVDASNNSGVLSGMTYSGNNGSQSHSGTEPRVVAMTSIGDTHVDADFGYEPPAANVALDVTLNTPGPARQSEPVSFTVTITNLDATPLTSLPVVTQFGQVYLDCTTASQTPDNATPNQLSWNNILATAGGITLNQNQVISFAVNCDAGLDTTLLPNQQAELQAMAGGEIDSDGIGIFAPTGVVMSKRSLDYDASTGQVTLGWTTADESQIVGFHVYRLTEKQTDSSRVTAASIGVVASEWMRLTEQPRIADSAGTSASNSYMFVDQLDPNQMEQVETAGGQLHYKLGVLTTEGSEFYLDLSQISQTQGERIHLPLIMR
ncbi:MAG: SdrD B-like domain-containing protein [Chloroflexota bacterium]